MPGWTFFFTQLISETWIRPSTPGFQLDERAVIGDVRDRALELAANRVLGLDAAPRIGAELLHAEADALRLRIDADDLHLHGVADVQNLGRMVDALPCHVGDVEQAVDAAQVDERAVIGDVLDDAVDNLALFELGHDLGALLGAGFLKHGAARDDDIAAPAIHFQDLEGLRHVHQGRYVLDRADIDLAAGKEGNGAVEIDGEAALDAIEDDAFDLLAGVELLLKLGPAILAAGLLAAEHRLASGILDALDIDFHLVANSDGGRLPGQCEFFERDAAFGLETHVDYREILFDGDDLALYHRAFGRRRTGQGLVEKSGKVFGCRTVFLGLWLYCLGSDH